MKKVAGKGSGGFVLAADFGGCAVKCVSDDGMAKRCHVHANLMSSSGVNVNFKQGEFAVCGIDSLRHFVMGNGFASGKTARGHASALDAVTADRAIDSAMV